MTVATPWKPERRAPTRTSTMVSPDTITAIDRARLLISVKKFDESREVLMDVLLDKGLSDEILGRALLQKGNLGMRIGDYKGAMRDFQSALDLAGISAQLRGAAKNGLEFADSFEKLRRR